MSWLEAFVWTCAIETPLYVLALRGSFRAWWPPVLISLGLQLTTHPLMWLLFPKGSNYWATFFVLETGVALVEGGLLALLFRRLGERRPLARGFLYGFAINAVSASIGCLL
ncbi:MAG TPA: hypothetical protein VF950_30165 [Planctomycetota bacterium]